MTTSNSERKAADLYRMVMPKHVCPYGLKAKDLLERRGFRVHDHWLVDRVATEQFKAEHQVQTTPQIFVGGERVGGYDALRKFVGEAVRSKDETTYQPVLVVFGMSAAMALAASWSAFGTAMTARALEWFVAFSMCSLAALKLRDLESFSTMFLNYDLLARRWVRYGTVYPFAEALVGVLMIAGVLPALSAPLALLIGGIGALSVFKAVYVDRRELKCACVGGASNVPLGFVSLVENLMMVAMGGSTLAQLLLHR